MGIFDQPKSTYDDTSNQVRVIDDVIKLIDPIDVPLIDALGGLDGANSKFDFKAKGTKVEWLK